jgi:Flp pilus assembly protein TadG
MRRIGSQRGAAMVEFIVGAVFFMVPLYLATQALGKFADVQQTANSAARYAAWEKTVWFEDTSSRFQSHNAANQKTTTQIRAEILARVLNDRRTGLIYKDTDKGAITLVNGQDTLWQDSAGTDYMSDISTTTLTSRYDRPTRDATGAAIDLINTISIPNITGTLAPPVPVNTMASTTFTLKDVAKDSAVYQRLWSKDKGLPDDWVGMDFEGRSGILTNTWSANASGGTRQMVEDSVPTASDTLKPILTTATIVALAAWDPIAASQIEYGKVAPDVVPKDRLK